MKKFFTSVLVALAFAFGANAQDADSLYARNLLKPGTEAPAFTLADENGKMVSLSDFRGKYVVLEFSASWCPDCRKIASDMDRLSWYSVKNPVAFVTVSFDDSREAWTGYIRSHNPRFPSKVVNVSELKKWKETEISGKYNIQWIPSMYIIDPEGKVLLGTVEIDKVRKALEELF